MQAPKNPLPLLEVPDPQDESITESGTAELTPLEPLLLTPYLPGGVNLRGSAQEERPLSPLPCAPIVEIALHSHPGSMAGLQRWISEQHPDWRVAA